MRGRRRTIAAALCLLSLLWPAQALATRAQGPAPAHRPAGVNRPAQALATRAQGPAPAHRPAGVNRPAGGGSVGVGSAGGHRSAGAGTGATAEAPRPVTLSETPPAGRRLSPDKVLEIAGALPRMKALRAAHPHATSGVYVKGPDRWQVSWFSKEGKEIGQVILEDRTGRVLEQWTGIQVAWSMARGYPGAFGGHTDALYVWLPLCLLFLLPFFDWRKPLRLLNLDLLVLLSLSISLAFFNHGLIFESVPAAYPPLLYLLGRMLWIALRRGRHPPMPVRLNLPVSRLAIGVLLIAGFRIALNVTDGNVIDVGYAGVIGAQRAIDGEPLYGGYPKENAHGDTYAPFDYEAYVPFVAALGWSGRWDGLPAAHAASIAFDLAAILLLFLLGRRVRGPALGLALAWAWVTYPFTLLALDSDSNDTLLAVLVLAALLAASYRGRRGQVATGALAALAALTKLAPLALVPVLATDGLSQVPFRRRARLVALFCGGFLIAAALAVVPAFAHDSLHTIYERVIAYQASRSTPFSVWGLYGLPTSKIAVEAIVALGAILLAFVPRRRGLPSLAACCAAILIALQLGLEYWFYLYIPWFFGLSMLALLEGVSERPSRPHARVRVAASGPARSSPLSSAASS